MFIRTIQIMGTVIFENCPVRPNETLKPKIHLEKFFPALVCTVA